MQELSQEQLNEIAAALNVLAKYGLLYGGFRRRQRRIAEVRVTKYLVVKYVDGDLRYLSSTAGKTYRLYIRFPPR
jgi:hypothetical protein